MKLKRIAMLASAAGFLTLAACSGGADESDQSADNVAPMAPIEIDNSMTEVPTEAPPATVVDNATTAAPAETVPSDLSSDEQTQDDAAATGMTARVSRDEGGNEAQPAE